MVNQYDNEWVGCAKIKLINKCYNLSIESLEDTVKILILDRLNI